MSNQLDILAFAAHPDDVELAASGTIMKHIADGLKVGIVDLTEGGLGSRGSVGLRYEEAENAGSLMGISERVNLQMADGFFGITEANKRLIIEQIRRFKPKTILINALSDRHPDHGRAGQLVAEAAFLSGLRKVETVHNNKPQKAYRPKLVLHYIQDFYIKPDVVIDISDYMERKIEVIKAYKSQFFNPSSSEPATPISGEDFFDFIKARAMEFGRPIGVKYAEGFTAERYLGVTSLENLI